MRVYCMRWIIIIILHQLKYILKKIKLKYWNANGSTNRIYLTHVSHVRYLSNIINFMRIHLFFYYYYFFSLYLFVYFFFFLFLLSAHFDGAVNWTQIEGEQKCSHSRLGAYPKIKKIDSRRRRRRKKSAKLTVFVHAHLKAFFQSTRLTLIAVCFIDDASASARLTPATKNRKKKHGKKIICGWVGRIDHRFDNFHFRQFKSQAKIETLQSIVVCIFIEYMSCPSHTTRNSAQVACRRNEKHLPKHQIEINHNFDWLNWRKREGKMSRT